MFVAEQLLGKPVSSRGRPAKRICDGAAVDLDLGLAVRNQDASGRPDRHSHDEESSGPPSREIKSPARHYKLLLAHSCAASRPQVAAIGDTVQSVEHLLDQRPPRVTLMSISPASTASTDDSGRTAPPRQRGQGGQQIARAAAHGMDLAMLVGRTADMAFLVALALLAPAPVCTEPWSRCSPDAVWLRRVLAHAGFPHPRQNGAALIIPTGRRSYPTQRFVWANRGIRPERFYRVVARIGGMPVRSDSVTVVWSVQGLHVWVQYPPPRRLLVQLVRATVAVKR
jgi:hypothetical protein